MPKVFFLLRDGQALGVLTSFIAFLRCDSLMFDNVLDWTTDLPKEDLKTSRRHCREADLVVCLGSSLRIEPAGGLAFLNRQGGKRTAICNLQNTPKDRKASMVLRGKVDEVMRIVMKSLGIDVPSFAPPSKLFVSYQASKVSRSKLVILTIQLTSDGLR